MWSRHCFYAQNLLHTMPAIRTKSTQINRQKNAATHSGRTPSEGHTGSRKKQNGEFPSLEEVLQLEDFTELRVAHGRECDTLEVGDWYVKDAPILISDVRL